jgi:hypothetical protein
VGRVLGASIAWATFARWYQVLHIDSGDNYCALHLCLRSIGQSVCNVQSLYDFLGLVDPASEGRGAASCTPVVHAALLRTETI